MRKVSISSPHHSPLEVDSATVLTTLVDAAADARSWSTFPSFFSVGSRSSNDLCSMNRRMCLQIRLTFVSLCLRVRVSVILTTKSSRLRRTTMHQSKSSGDVDGRAETSTRSGDTRVKSLSFLSSMLIREIHRDEGGEFRWAIVVHQTRNVATLSDRRKEKEFSQGHQLVCLSVLSTLDHPNVCLTGDDVENHGDDRSIFANDLCPMRRTHRYSWFNRACANGGHTDRQTDRQV